MNVNNAFLLPEHQYITRHRNMVIPAHARLQNTSKSLNHICPRFWNQIPGHIKGCETLNKFKRDLKSFLVQKYSD